MEAMIVGADRLGNIPEVLGEMGIRVVRHVSGRNSAHQRNMPGLPPGIDLLILFTDFLGHNVMKTFRQAAQRQGTRVVACRRSASCMRESLQALGLYRGCEHCPARRAGNLSQ